MLTAIFIGFAARLASTRRPCADRVLAAFGARGAKTHGAAAADAGFGRIAFLIELAGLAFSLFGFAEAGRPIHIPEDARTDAKAHRLARRKGRDPIADRIAIEFIEPNEAAAGKEER